MGISAKSIVSRFLTQGLVKKVAREFKRRQAMSLERARELLGVRSNASDAEINAAYRQKFIENKRLHSDAGGDESVLKDLNVAKDTLMGKYKPDHGISPGSSQTPSGDTGAPGAYNPPPAKPAAREVSFAEARSKGDVPVNARWLFVTESQSSGYSSDEFLNRATGYVAVGETDSAWVFTSVEHYERDTYVVGLNDRKENVYTIQTFKLPKNGPATPQLLYGGVVKAWKGFESLDKSFNSKIKILPSDWDFADFGKRSWSHSFGRSTTIKNYLVDSGQVAESDLKVPRKLVVEFKYESSFDAKPGFAKLRNYGRDFERLTLIINAREYPLDESEAKKLCQYKVSGKFFLVRVFGDHFYGGEVKSLSKNRDGKVIMKWMAENLRWDSNVSDLLNAAYA